MNLTSAYNFFWMLESHSQQRLAWEDAAQARVARDRAEKQARARMRAMLTAYPSGALGTAQLNDEEELKRSGLL